MFLVYFRMDAPYAYTYCHGGYRYTPCICSMCVLVRHYGIWSVFVRFMCPFKRCAIAFFCRDVSPSRFDNAPHRCNFDLTGAIFHRGSAMAQPQGPMAHCYGVIFSSMARFSISMVRYRSETLRWARVKERKDKYQCLISCVL